MQRSDLPTYAIVELLIRLAGHNSAIGDYKDHKIYENGVFVKTSAGSISFPQALITQQYEAPELITDDELVNTSLLFRAAS